MLSGEVQVTRNGRVVPSELNELFRTNNWHVDSLDNLERSLETSWCWIVARNEQGQLIGYVQAISDWIQHAYVLKMIVHPDFRKQGIGTKIMEELLSYVTANKMLPTLVATKGNVHFYEKFGFKSEIKGLTAMCVR